MGPIADELLNSHGEKLSTEDSETGVAACGPWLGLDARVCNFSCRVRASWRAKAREHSLQTYGLDPVSLTVSLLHNELISGLGISYGSAHVSVSLHQHASPQNRRQGHGPRERKGLYYP